MGSNVIHNNYAEEGELGDEARVINCIYAGTKVSVNVVSWCATGAVHHECMDASH